MTAPDHHIDTATLVLDGLQAHDFWFPSPSPAAVVAWAAAFAQSGHNREDILAGVAHARAHHTRTAAERNQPTEQFRPTPDLIVRHAHLARRDTLAQLDPDQRERMDAANHLLQEMGYTPREAHRLSRDLAIAAATGRNPHTVLTPEQHRDLDAKLLAHRKEVAEKLTTRRETLARIGRLADRIALETALKDVS